MEIRKDQQESLEIWQQHPMTQWYFEQIEKQREWYKEYLADGRTLGDLTEVTTAHKVGIIAGLNFCTVFEPIEEGDDGTQT